MGIQGVLELVHKLKRATGSLGAASAAAAACPKRSRTEEALRRSQRPGRALAPALGEKKGLPEVFAPSPVLFPLGRSHLHQTLPDTKPVPGGNSISTLHLPRVLRSTGTCKSLLDSEWFQAGSPLASPPCGGISRASHWIDCSTPNERDPRIEEIWQAALASPASHSQADLMSGMEQNGGVCKRGCSEPRTRK